MILLSLGLLCGCSDYLLRQGLGRLTMLVNERDVEDVLADPCVADWRKERIRFVLEVKQFAEEELGLARTGNYTRYYNTGGKPVAYALVVCPVDSLKPHTWRFAGVGEVPYLGFFDLSDVLEYERRFDKRNFDTYIAPVAAFSSLGWLKDPILSSFLAYDEAELAELIIHELTHGTVFFSDDIELSESAAMFVGREGARLFLQKRHGAAAVSKILAHLDAVERDRRKFDALMNGVVKELEALYASPTTREEKLRRKAEVLQEAAKKFREFQVQAETDSYKKFSTIELNNAVIVAYRTYHELIPMLERLHEALGRDLRQTVQFLKGTEKSSEPRKEIERKMERGGAK